MVQVLLGEGGAVQQCHRLQPAVVRVREDVHAPDERQMVIDDDDLLVHVLQVHRPGQLYADRPVQVTQGRLHLLRPEHHGMDDDIAVLGGAQVRQQLL